jgi:SPOR domain
MKASAITIVSLLLILASCRTIQIPQGNKKTPPVVAEYDEDLSSVRPRYNVSAISTEPKYETSQTPVEASKPSKVVSSEITMHVNDQVAAILDTLTARNKAIRYADGYKIQLYVGNVREDVEAAKLYALQLYPELSPYMTFNQPTYRLKIGDFMSRSDADRYLTSFRQQYPGSTIVADKIDLKKSVMVK